MNKSNIRVFGEISIAHVEKRGLFSYAVVRDFDKKVLAKSFSFRKYITMLFVQCIPENITQRVITYWLLTL